MSVSEDLKKLCFRLFEVDAVKFGSYLLKNGFYSPIYIDLRVITSYPKLLEDVAKHLWDVAVANGIQCDSVCGVPYTALPIATVIAVKQNIPMVVRRREAKDYGTKKMVEGHFKENDCCLIVEDVVTSGTSIMETVQTLNNVGLKVSDAIVLLDRDQGAVPNLAKEGIKLYSVLTIHQMVAVLQAEGKIDSAMVVKVKEFLSVHGSTSLKPSILPPVPNGTPLQKTLRYEARAEMSKHPLTKQVFHLMHEKRSNLAVAVDVTTTKQLLQLAEAVGPYVCLLKTHIDILTDFQPEVIDKLKQLAAKHRFLLFEDRKFCDIGNTVCQQYQEGVFHIAQWADLVNAHPLPGPGVIKGLKKSVEGQSRACLLVAEMSSEGNLASQDYVRAAVTMAEENQDFVVGFICQSRLSNNPALLHCTPGVQLNPPAGDGLGQLYLSPEEVITKRGADVIIVGRGVTQAADPGLAAKLHQEAGYLAYLSTVQQGSEV